MTPVKTDHLLLALSGLLLLACADPAGPGQSAGDKTDGTDDGTPAASCVEGEPRIELGTGETSFEPLEDGDPVIVVNGPQGGQHILGSLKTWNMTGIATVHFTIQRASDQSYVSDQVYRLQLFEEGDCAWSYIGMYGYLGFVAAPNDDSFLWLDAIMRMEVTDENGRTASDEVTVVPELGAPIDEPTDDPPGDPPEDP